MNKQELAIKKDIAKRLRKSDEGLWKTLSEEKRNSIVDRYYDLSGIKSVGLIKVLEDNRTVRRESYGIVLGILFGLFGGMAGNILANYFPKTGLFNFFIIFGFGFIIWLFIHLTEKDGIDHLREDRVLKYLVEEAEVNH